VWNDDDYDFVASESDNDYTPSILCGIFHSVLPREVQRDSSVLVSLDHRYRNCSMTIHQCRAVGHDYVFEMVAAPSLPDEGWDDDSVA
jgi:hypothetical protein